MKQFNITLLTHVLKINTLFSASLFKRGTGVPETIHTTKGHNKMKGSPHPKATMFKLTSKLSKETGQLNQLNSARRSRSVSSFLSQPVHGERKTFLANVEGTFGSGGTTEGPFNSRHVLPKKIVTKKKKSQ